MNRFLAIIGILMLAGCATLSSKPDPERTAQDFFNSVQKEEYDEAYRGFSQPLRQAISSGQFHELMGTIQEEWGKLQDFESVIMPFHRRPGEEDFIPPGIVAEQVKRYIYELKFENAPVKCDLTLVQEGDQYKIAWFSFWGDNASMTPNLREKMESSFQKPLF